MWGEFWLAVLVGFAFLYVPAYVILRVLRFSRVSSAACAPLGSLLFYSLVAILYGKLGIGTNGWTLFAPLCFVALVVLAVGFLRRRRVADSSNEATREASFGTGRFWGTDSWLILLYLGVGLVVGSYIFLGSLTTPDCSSYTYDDYSHLAYIQSFVERGNFSSLDANYQYDLGYPNAYYPAAWHLLAASVITLCGIPNYVGANVAIFLSCSCIYPLSCLFLVRKIFRRDAGMQVVGAFFTLTFAAFPWEFVYYGRLVSNMLGFCFAPVMLGCTMYVFGHGEDRAQRIRFAGVLLASFLLSVFTQPSVCFTWIVFSVPYLMHVIWNVKGKDGRPLALRKKVLYVGLFCLGVFLFLIFCYMLPFLYSVTRFKWRAPMTPLDALGIVLMQSFPSEGFEPAPGSPVLAVAVFVGLIFALRKSQTRWLVLLWALLGLMYVISAGTNWPLKNYMTGWWYTDSHRVLAMFAIISYVVAALGVSSVVGLAFRKRKQGKGLLVAQASGALVVAVLALFPSFWIGQTYVETPIGCLKWRIGVVYSAEMPDESSFYSQPEREFVEQAAEITGDDKVFNIPKDGSLFAYPSSGMKTVLRWDLAGFSGDASTRIVQRSLDDLATDASVRNAVNDLGFKYVLLLDKGHEPGMESWGGVSYKSWAGPTSITEETPGFELVLSEGDMELYRVLSEEETAQQLEQRAS